MKKGTMCCGCGHTFYAEECEVCAAEERDVLRNELGERDQEVQALTDELKRFREREPLVQRLMEEAEENFVGDYSGYVDHKSLRLAAGALRDFGSCSSSATDTTGAAAETAAHSLEGNAQARETTEE